MRSLRHVAKLPRYSHKVNRQINVIYEKVTKTFNNLTPTADEINCALKAMELIAPLSDRDAAYSYLRFDRPFPVGYSPNSLFTL